MVQIITLSALVGVSYASNNKLLESTVGPHLLHVVTISLLIVLATNPTEVSRSYAKIYSWTNLGIDNVTLTFLLYRSISQDADVNVDFALYIVCVIALLIIDVHNVSVSYEIYIQDQTRDIDVSEQTTFDKPPHIPTPTDVESQSMRRRSRTLGDDANIRLLNLDVQGANKQYDIGSRQHPALKRNM